MLHFPLTSISHSFLFLGVLPNPCFDGGSQHYKTCHRTYLIFSCFSEAPTVCVPGPLMTVTCQRKINYTLKETMVGGLNQATQWSDVLGGRFFFRKCVVSEEMAKEFPQIVKTYKSLDCIDCKMVFPFLYANSMQQTPQMNLHESPTWF